MLWTFVTCSSDDRVVELCAPQLPGTYIPLGAFEVPGTVDLEPRFKASAAESQRRRLPSLQSRVQLTYAEETSLVEPHRQMACDRPDCNVPAEGKLPATLARMTALHTLYALPVFLAVVEVAASWWQHINLFWLLQELGGQRVIWYSASRIWSKRICLPWSPEFVRSSCSSRCVTSVSVGFSSLQAGAYAVHILQVPCAYQYARQKLYALAFV